MKNSHQLEIKTKNCETSEQMVRINKENRISISKSNCCNMTFMYGLNLQEEMKINNVEIRV